MEWLLCAFSVVVLVYISKHCDFVLLEFLGVRGIRSEEYLVKWAFEFFQKCGIEFCVLYERSTLSLELGVIGPFDGDLRGLSYPFLVSNLDLFVGCEVFEFLDLSVDGLDLCCFCLFHVRFLMVFSNY